MWLLLALLVDPVVHLVAPFFLERLERAFVAQFSLFIVLLLLKKDVSEVVEAIRVVLVQVDGILVRKNGIVVHI